MARQPLLVVLAVIIVVLMAIVFVVTTQTPTGYTSKVSCVDSVTITFYASTFSNGSQASETTTAVTSFTTTANSSATVGHVTTQSLVGHLFLTGEATTERTCTFVR